MSKIDPSKVFELLSKTSIKSLAKYNEDIGDFQTRYFFVIGVIYFFFTIFALSNLVIRMQNVESGDSEKQKPYGSNILCWVLAFTVLSLASCFLYRAPAYLPFNKENLGFDFDFDFDNFAIKPFLNTQSLGK